VLKWPKVKPKYGDLKTWIAKSKTEQLNICCENFLRNARMQVKIACKTKRNLFSEKEKENEDASLTKNGKL